jgi:hypothetical protein
MARFSDGSVRDVTLACRLEMLNESAAEISADGLVTAKSGGAATVLARYMGKTAVVNLLIPYARIDPDPAFQSSNYIDDLVSTKWKQLGLRPAKLSGDTQFLRRVYLDLIGVLPAEREIRAFVADKSTDKRSKLIDSLLERPEYVDFWTLTRRALAFAFAKFPSVDRALEGKLLDAYLMLDPFPDAHAVLRALKAQGDLQSKLRATEGLLRDDLVQPHFDANQKLSNLDGNREVFAIIKGALSQVTHTVAGPCDELVTPPCGNVNPHISSNGRWTVFESTEDIENDGATNRRVFQYNLENGKLLRLSRSRFGDNRAPQLRKKRFVVWESTSNLTGGNPNNESVIYLFDRKKD